MKKVYLYLGKEYEIGVRPGQKNIVELSDKIYIGSPGLKYIDSYILSWYREQARKIIKDRVNIYSARHKIEFNSVNIGNISATTRWGSCSSQKNLNFNWKLIMAPISVIDYVVVHELSHLSELNHSRNFWENVRKMLPLYREHRTWLRRYGNTLSL